MKQIDNYSVDMIFCDLPYGTTKPIKNELEKLGYKVYQGSQYNESYCSISW